MKKVLSVILSVFLLAALAVPALAAPAAVTTERVELANGGYAVITTTVERPDAALFVARSSRRASKTYKAYDLQDRLVWSYTLTGRFSYDGSSAEATDAYDGYTIYDSTWSLDSKDAYYSGDTAYGEAYFIGDYDDGSCSLSITCSPDGEIS